MGLISSVGLLCPACNDYMLELQVCKRPGVGPAVAGFDIPKVRLPIAGKLARFILREGLEGGVDFAFSEEPALDHAEIAPMMHLTPRRDLPKSSIA